MTVLGHRGGREITRNFRDEEACLVRASPPAQSEGDRDPEAEAADCLTLTTSRGSRVAAGSGLMHLRSSDRAVAGLALPASVQGEGNLTALTQKWKRKKEQWHDLEAEVEETLKRLQSQKGVQGIIVVNTEGIPIKSTMDNPTTTQYANLTHNFILKARSTVREIDPQNDLTFLRIRSKKNEIMVAPDKDYFLIVIQNPTE
uniref:uncharacterized protein LOC129520444 n=1 Tax=Nyctereutes procyonoides TaxID=34880 RepID=UPI0024444DC5|nr:uncharacterized protein LOC129520444 [Nyctereutes procyonoides]